MCGHRWDTEPKAKYMYGKFVNRHRAVVLWNKSTGTYEEAYAKTALVRDD